MKLFPSIVLGLVFWSALFAFLPRPLFYHFAAIVAWVVGLIALAAAASVFRGKRK